MTDSNPISRSQSPEIEITELENKKRRLNDSLKKTRKRLRGRGSFDADFWKYAGEIDTIAIEKSRVQRKISLQRYEGTEQEWENTDEAKELNQVLNAQCLRASFMKLFTTSRVGLGIPSDGAGKRDSSDQSKFRSDMIEAYNSKHNQREWLWCPILGWRESDNIVAAHLFAYMHGQTTMDAIFGRTKTPELFSPRNGILVDKSIKKYLDCGKLVIVPNLAERPRLTELLEWLTSEVRSLKIQILDQTWNMLDKAICPYSPMTWREIDNRPLQFRSDFRPAARYIYYHYVIQVLRNAWQSDSQSRPEAVKTMKEEHGKFFWGTPGRYLPKNMLLALVEELGHEYEPLMDGSTLTSGSQDALLLLETGAKQIKLARPSLKALGFGEGVADSDGERSDDDDDDESDDPLY